MSAEIRCPGRHRRLFGKIEGDESTLFSVVCRDCRKDHDGKLVVHEFDGTGELIRTMVADV